MNLVQIALRNLGRQKSRTMLSFISIAVGVLVVLLTKGFVDGVLDTMIDGTIRFSSGHVRIVEPEYPMKEQLLSLNYTLHEDVVSKLQGIQGLSAVSPRVRFGGLISRGEQTDGVMVTAVNPLLEEPMSQMSRFLRGRWMNPEAREAVLGGQLLNRLGLQVGDRFTLVFNTAFGSMRGFTFEVVGQLDSGFMFLDDNNIFIDLGLAQSMLEMEGEVTEVLVLANRESDVPKLLPEIQQVIGDGATAVPWYSHSEMIEYLKVAQGSYLIIYLFILALASFVVINTMVMIINERMREIGMLGALGLSPRQIMILFLYEGGIMGVGGSLLGALLGGVVLWATSITGLQLMDPSTFDAQFFLTPKIFPRFDGLMLLYVVALGTIVTTVAVWLPARQAAKLEPTKALRGNA